VTAFSDLAGSFVILSSMSYVLAIAPNILTGRRFMPKGSFYMGAAGWLVNVISVVFIIFFDIMFCFRQWLSLAPEKISG
jgi:choline transport protein